MPRGDLALVSAAGEVVVRDARGMASLTPGDAVAVAVALSELERARAASGSWHVGAGGLTVRVVEQGAPDR
ncbi:MAG TPA: hypothetical protein VIK12_07120 [Pengzhenrongella sp.]